MNPRTPREKWLLSMLPALVVYLIVSLAWLHPAEVSLSSLRAKVKKQGPASAREALITEAKAENARLRQEVAAKRAAPAVDIGGFDRNLAMQQVSLLCVEHGLSLNNTTAEGAAKLPAAMQEAAGAVAHEPGATQPQVWRIELSGAYAGVVGLLEGLRQTKPLIVPLNLSMETGRNERMPARWVLTLWL